MKIKVDNLFIATTTLANATTALANDATALVNDATAITRNVRECKRTPNLRVEEREARSYR